MINLKKYLWLGIASILSIVGLIFRGKLQRLARLEAQARVNHLDEHLTDLRTQIATDKLSIDSSENELRRKQAEFRQAAKKARGKV